MASPKELADSIARALLRQVDDTIPVSGRNLPVAFTRDGDNRVTDIYILDSAGTLSASASYSAAGYMVYYSGLS